MTTTGLRRITPVSVVEEILVVADTHGTIDASALPGYRASSSVMRGNWGHADSDSTGDPDRAWSVPATPATHAGSNWPPTPVMMNDEELLAEMALLKKKDKIEAKGIWDLREKRHKRR